MVAHLTPIVSVDIGKKNLVCGAKDCYVTGKPSSEYDPVKGYNLTVGQYYTKTGLHKERRLLQKKVDASGIQSSLTTMSENSLKTGDYETLLANTAMHVSLSEILFRVYGSLNVARLRFKTTQEKNVSIR